MSKMRVLIAVFTLVAATTVARADDNPEYTNWAKFKPGTTAKLKMSNEFGGNKTATTIVTKLLEVKDDKLVLEMETETEVMGKPFKVPAQKREVKKTIEVKDGQPKPGVKPEGTTEEGTETVKVSGNDVKSKWYKFKTKTPQGEVTGQMWTSEDVPGMVVKMTSKTEMFSMVMELVEFTKK